MKNEFQSQKKSNFAITNKGISSYWNSKPNASEKDLGCQEFDSKRTKSGRKENFKCNKQQEKLSTNFELEWNLSSVNLKTIEELECRWRSISKSHVATRIKEGELVEKPSGNWN